MVNKVINCGMVSDIFKFKYSTDAFNATSRAVVFPINSLSFTKTTVHNILIENAIYRVMNNVE